MIFTTLLTTTSIAAMLFPTAPHWAGGFGDSLKNRRKSYASIRSYGFFHASRFMVGALGGRSRPAGFCSPVRQPDALTARGLATSDGDLLTVIGEQTMNSIITISAVSIRQDNQSRFSLNDLHKASIVDGQNARTKEPGKFLASPQTIELVAEYETQNLGIKAIEKIIGRGKAQGTYAVKELVYAYAMWISPKFALQVIRAYDAMQTNNTNPSQQLEHEVDFLQREHMRLSNQLAQCLSVDLSAHEGLEKISLKFKSTGYSYGRWTVTLSDGLFTIKPMQDDEFLITSEKLAMHVGDKMGGTVKYEHLPSIIKAAAERLDSLRRA